MLPLAAPRPPPQPPLRRHHLLHVSCASVVSPYKLSGEPLPRLMPAQQHRYTDDASPLGPRPVVPSRRRASGPVLMDDTHRIALAGAFDEERAGAIDQQADHGPVLDVGLETCGGSTAWMAAMSARRRGWRRRGGRRGWGTSPCTSVHAKDLQQPDATRPGCGRGARRNCSAGRPRDDPGRWRVRQSRPQRRQTPTMARTSATSTASERHPDPPPACNAIASRQLHAADRGQKGVCLWLLGSAGVTGQGARVEDADVSHAAHHQATSAFAQRAEGRPEHTHRRGGDDLRATVRA